MPRRRSATWCCSPAWSRARRSATTASRTWRESWPSGPSNASRCPTDTTFTAPVGSLSNQQGFGDCYRARSSRGPAEAGHYVVHGADAVAARLSEYRMPVYCISSHVWSPHFTAFVGSGFDLFAAELSYHAVETIRAPFGTAIGSRNM